MKKPIRNETNLQLKDTKWKKNLKQEEIASKKKK